MNLEVLEILRESNGLKKDDCSLDYIFNNYSPLELFLNMSKSEKGKIHILDNFKKIKENL